MSITSDQLRHLGKVAEWLANVPNFDTEYGEFRVTEVVIRFEGEPAGVLIEHDDTWNYYAEDEKRPVLSRPHR